jgi:hypothetical protein
MPLRPIDFSKPRFIAFGLVAAAALTLVLAAILWMSHRAYLEQAEPTASKLVRALGSYPVDLRDHRRPPARCREPARHGHARGRAGA